MLKTSLTTAIALFSVFSCASAQAQATHNGLGTLQPYACLHDRDDPDETGGEVAQSQLIHFPHGHGAWFGATIVDTDSSDPFDGAGFENAGAIWTGLGGVPFKQVTVDVSSPNGCDNDNFAIGVYDNNNNFDGFLCSSSGVFSFQNLGNGIVRYRTTGSATGFSNVSKLVFAVYVPDNQRNQKTSFGNVILNGSITPHAIVTARSKCPAVFGPGL
ncbi:MAG: hypothetical protein ACREO5_09980 [Candidatus Binatia bacterium]